MFLLNIGNIKVTIVEIIHLCLDICEFVLCNHPPLQTCSYWYSYNDTMELIAGASEQIYHFEELINAGVV